MAERDSQTIGMNEPPAQRMRQAMAMQQLGIQLLRQRLLRLAREAGEPTDDAAIDAKLYAWLLHRPGERSDTARLAALRAKVGVIAPGGSAAGSGERDRRRDDEPRPNDKVLLPRQRREAVDVRGGEALDEGKGQLLRRRGDHR
ncbi:MAG: hypothetical protein RIT45_1241 [Pseudomonadota bacterium]